MKSNSWTVWYSRTVFQRRISFLFFCRYSIPFLPLVSILSNYHFIFFHEPPTEGLIGGSENSHNQSQNRNSPYSPSSSNIFRVSLHHRAPTRTVQPMTVSRNAHCIRKWFSPSRWLIPNVLNREKWAKEPPKYGIVVIVPLTRLGKLFGGAIEWTKRESGHCWHRKRTEPNYKSSIK